MQERNSAAKSAWQRTQYSNLVRYVPSGVFFARVRVQGKLIRRSLKTDKITVAKLRLDDLQKQLRHAGETQQAVAKGRMTFADALRTYRQRLAGDASLKSGTRNYYQQRMVALLESWPELEKLDSSPSLCSRERCR